MGVFVGGAGCIPSESVKRNLASAALSAPNATSQVQGKTPKSMMLSGRRGAEVNPRLRVGHFPRRTCFSNVANSGHSCLSRTYLQEW
jgi:hypothetical protein